MSLSELTTRLSDILTIISMFLTLMFFFTKKKPQQNMVLPVAIGVVLEMMLIYALEWTIGTFFVYFVSFLVAAMVFAHVFLEGKWYSHLLVSYTYCAAWWHITCIEHVLTDTFLPVLREYGVTHAFMAQIALFVLVWLLRCAGLNDSVQRPMGYWLIVFSVATLSIFFNIVMDDSWASWEIMLLVYGAMLLLLIFTFYFCMRMSVEEKEKSELRRHNERLMLDSQKAREMEVLYQDARRFRHDMRNHLRVIASMAGDAGAQKIVNYISELDPERLDVRNNVHSGNLLADVVLSQKSAQAEQMGVDMEIDAQLPVDLPVYEADMSALLFNLLDNALEGAVGAKGPVVRVQLHVQKNYFGIKVWNSVDHDVLEMNPTMQTTKDEAELHGVGMSIIRSIVEKYDGMLQCGMQDGGFCVSAMLRLTDATEESNL